MLNIFITSIMIMIIAIITMSIASILSKKSFYDREKNSPFECGFEPKSSARMPFSLHFFLITIIFLVFDVEIALILPMILLMNDSNMIIWFTVCSYFLLILLIGLYHEWNQGMLEWVN